MPRKTRMYLPGVPCHVIQRGNNREACFFAQQDYLFYLGCLGDACYRYHVWRRKKGEVVTGLYFQLAWRNN